MGPITRNLRLWLFFISHLIVLEGDYGPQTVTMFSAHWFLVHFPWKVPVPSSHVGNQEIPFFWIKIITPSSVSGVIPKLYVTERSNLQVLYDDLLDGYNPNVRPVLHNTHSVQIHANMKMQQIISMVRNTNSEFPSISQRN